MRKGDVVALHLRADDPRKKNKNGRFYFGIVQDHDIRVHNVKTDKWFLSTKFPSPHIFNKTIFRCGRILLRKVKWYCWSYSRDLPGQTISKQNVPYVRWLMENGPVHWIGDCSKYNSLEILRSDEFMKKSHVYDEGE